VLARTQFVDVILMLFVYLFLRPNSQAVTK